MIFATYDPSSGPKVLVIHGLPIFSDFWLMQELLESLADLQHLVSYELQEDCVGKPSDRTIIIIIVVVIIILLLLIIITLI